MGKLLIAGLVGSVAFLWTGEPAYSQGIPAPSLLQYQYGVDVPDCNISLEGGLQIEFDGVFANEDGQIVFYEIVNFVIRSEEPFGMSSLVTASGGGSTYLGKVVQNHSGRVYISFGTDFLNAFWGSSDIFVVRQSGGDSPQIYLTLPSDAAAARAAISAGRTCQEDAYAAD